MIVFIVLVLLLGLVIEFWPVIVAVIVVCIVARVVATIAYAHEQATERAREQQIRTYRKAVAYWQGELERVDSPAAIKTASDLVAYNQARLAELGANTGQEKLT